MSKGAARPCWSAGGCAGTRDVISIGMSYTRGLHFLQQDEDGEEVREVG
jgi:hypothetical protein